MRSDPKMFIVKVIGGLGNQMFQYAFARSLSKRKDVEVILDTTEFDSYNLHDYSLTHFNLKLKIATRKEVQALTNKRRRWFGTKTKVYHEPHFYFCSEAFTQTPSLYYDGYWQTEKYFSSITEDLRSDFQIVTPIDAENAAWIRKIRSVNAVSIHVRRGDYVTNTSANKIHGLSGLDYYRKAVELIKSKTQFSHFFIFSDDPIWVRENLKIDGPVDYIDHNGPEKNYEDMRLMSNCHSHIIANSTFSWWGAWLNPDPSKIVIAPKVWFGGGQHDDRDLIPKSWIRL